MSEKSFWVLLRNSMKHMKMYRVENRVMQGMPDVHYIKDGKTGWIELKYLPEWPKKRMSIGLRKTQSFWLKQYDEQKGKCWVMLRIGRDYIALIDGKDAPQLYDMPSKKDFRSIVRWSKKGNMKQSDWDELVDVVTG
jgi:hypothetical protein